MDNIIDKNIKSIPKLLRSIANTSRAKENKHDVIFNEAANLIEHLAAIRKTAKEIVRENKNVQTS